MKHCNICNTDKPKSDFHMRRASGDGLAHKCKTCVAEYRAKNKTMYKNLRKAWHEKHKESERAKALAYYHSHRESRRQKHIEYMLRTADQQRNYRKLKNAEYVARTAKRRASLEQRTPKWLTEQDIKQMQKVYKTAQEFEKITGVPHHVDHEIPLRGRMVSGLHVPSNLRVIPAVLNVSKSNKYDPV